MSRADRARSELFDRKASLFAAESFANTYQIFILIHVARTLAKSTVTNSDADRLTPGLAPPKESERPAPFARGSAKAQRQSSCKELLYN